MFAGLALGCECSCCEAGEVVVVHGACCASVECTEAEESPSSAACNCVLTCQEGLLNRRMKGGATIIDFRRVDSALTTQRLVGEFSGDFLPVFSDTVCYTVHSNGFVQAILCCFIC